MKSAIFRLFTGTFCLLISLFIVVPLWDCAYSLASDYPEHPITIVVPYAPGGTTDVLARATAIALEKHLNQSIIITNKTGGGTTIAGSYVANSKPDGYTIGFFTSSTYVPDLLGLTEKVPYNSEDLKPISGIMDVNTGFLVKGDSGINTMKDLVDYARKNPGIKMATLGKQSTSAYVLILWSKKANIKYVPIPYQGGAKMVPAILGGHVIAGLTGMDPTIKGLIDAGKLNCLAVTSDKRLEVLPDVPSLVELGYRAPFFVTCGLFGPKGMPDEVVEKIDDAVSKIVKEPEFQKKAFEATVQLKYMDSATYQENLMKHREFLNGFLIEEGFLK